jgi:hypothetical protein
MASPDQAKYVRSQLAAAETAERAALVGAEVPLLARTGVNRAEVSPAERGVPSRVDRGGDADGR